MTIRHNDVINMKSTFYKTFLVTSLLLLFSFIILGSSIAVFAYRFFIRERQGSLLDTAVEISNRAGQNVYSGNININRYFEEVVRSYAKLSDTYIIITNNLGEVIVTSDEISIRSLTTKLYVGEEVMRQTILNGGYSGFGTLGEAPGQRILQRRCAGILLNGDIVGTVFVSTTGRNLREMIFDFIRIFISTAAAVLLLSLAWTFIAAQG